MSFGEEAAPKKGKGKTAQAKVARTVADLVIGEVFEFAEAPMITVMPQPRKDESDRDYVRRAMERRNESLVVHRRAPYKRAMLSHHGGGIPFVRFVNDEGKVSKNAYSVSAHLEVVSPPAPPVNVVADLAELIGG